MYVRLRETALSPDEAAARSVRADGSVGGTFAHAAPHAEAGDTWPSCPLCGRAYDLVYQVDPSEGPWSADHSGLFSVFVCSQCVAEARPASLVRHHADPMGARRVRLEPPIGWEPDPIALEPAEEFESPEQAFGLLACDESWMGGLSHLGCRACGAPLRVLCKLADVPCGPYSLELAACLCARRDAELHVLRDKG